MENITQQVREFVKEARALADSFSDVGQDDNSYDSYDAGCLADEGEEVIKALEAGKETSKVAEMWLKDAKEQLDQIG